MTKEKPRRRSIYKKINKEKRKEITTKSAGDMHVEYEKTKERIKFECLEFSWRFIQLDLIHSEDFLVLPNRKESFIQILDKCWIKHYKNGNHRNAYGIGNGCQVALSMLVNEKYITNLLFNDICNSEIPPWHPDHEVGSVWWEEVLDFYKTLKTPRIREKRAIKTAEILKNEGFKAAKKYLQVNYGK